MDSSVPIASKSLQTLACELVSPPNRLLVPSVKIVKIKGDIYESRKNNL